MAKKKKAAPKEESLSFEDALERLESVVRALESSDLGLNDAMKQYEEGVRYVRVCHKTLAEAETKIEMLTRVDAEGNSEGRPFDASDDETLEDKQDRRANRRSAKPPELF